MDLLTAQRNAASQSRTEHRTIYINLDNEGSSVLSHKFDKDSSILAYHNGMQVSMDEKNEKAFAKEDKENKAKQKELDIKNQSKMKNKKEVPAKKVSKSEAKEVKGKAAKGNDHGSMKVFPGLLYKGQPVYMTGGETKKWSKKISSRV